MTGDHLGFVFVDLRKRSSTRRPSSPLRRRRRTRSRRWRRRYRRSSRTGRRLVIRVEGDALVSTASPSTTTGHPAPTRTGQRRCRLRAADDDRVRRRQRLRRHADGDARPVPRAIRRLKEAYAQSRPGGRRARRPRRDRRLDGRYRHRRRTRTATPSRAASSSCPTGRCRGKPAPDDFAELRAARRREPGITSRDETYNGTTITVDRPRRPGDLAALAGALGGGTCRARPSGVPAATSRSPTSPPTRSSSIGSSPDFVKHVLDAGAGASLADDARFKGLRGRVGSQHSSVSFVDVAAIRGLVEASMADASTARTSRIRGVDEAVPDAVRCADRARASSAARPTSAHGRSPSSERGYEVPSPR